jgi:hypothetical protein
MARAKRLLITGTRHGWDHDHLESVLREWHRNLSEYGQQVILVHGDADGVDTQARDIWHEMGYITEPHPANWKKFGMKAGPIRNTEMVQLHADQCIAFPDQTSVGTHDCASKARRAGIPTETYRSPTKPPPAVLDGQMDLFTEGD